MQEANPDDSYEALLMVIRSVIDIHLRIARDAKIPERLRDGAAVDVTLTMLKGFYTQGKYNRGMEGCQRVTMAQRFAIYVFTWGPERKWQSQYGPGGHLHDLLFKEAYPDEKERQ